MLKINAKCDYELSVLFLGVIVAFGLCLHWLPVWQPVLADTASGPYLSITFQNLLARWVPDVIYLMDKKFIVGCFLAMHMFSLAAGM